MKIPVFHQVLQDHMGETYQVGEREYQVGLTTWPILITYLRGQKKLALMFWCHSADFKKTRTEIWLEGIQIADVADTKEIQGELKDILEDDLPQLAKLILG